MIELWTFVIVISGVFLWLGGQRLDTLKGPYFVSLARFWFLFGMVFQVAYFIDRSRVELLKEIKHVQVLELHALLSTLGS